MKKFATLLFLIVALSLNAQPFQEVSIAGSQIRKLTSNIVSGQEYELQIMLPSGYENRTVPFY